MYKLTTINIEKIECPILIRKVAGSHSSDITDITQEYRFTTGAELAASSFEEKYDIKTVRICKDRDSSGGSRASSSSRDASGGSQDAWIEILVSKPECEQPISRNKDDSFF